MSLSEMQHSTNKSPLSLARATAVLSLIRDLILNESDVNSVSLGDLQDAAREGKLFTKRELEAAVNDLVIQKRIQLDVDPVASVIDIYLAGEDLPLDVASGAREAGK